MSRQLFAVIALLAAVVAADIRMTLSAPATSTEPQGKKTKRTDRYGDHLPEGAVLRLGTARFSQPSPRNLIFTPDGKFLISAGSDKPIRIWDADTGKEVRALDGHKGGAHLISLSADGKRLASCGFDYELLLWEFDTGKARKFFRRPDRMLQILSLSPNGKILATSDLNTLRLYDMDTGNETLTLPHPRRHGPEALAFTADSKQLAYSDFANQDIHVLDVATGKEIGTFESHKSRIYQLIFTPDGKTLFSCSFDHTIRSWDVASGEEKQRYGDEKQTVGCFALAPDRKTLTYSTGFLVHIWDLETNKDRMPPCKSKAWITPAIAYSPDSKKVAVGGEAIAIYETASGKRLNPGLEWESPVHQIKYALGGEILLVWRGYDNTIELWDTAKWSKLRTLRPKLSYFLEMIVSPNGKHLTTGEGDTSGGKRQGIICTWDLQTGTRQREFPLNDSWFDSLSYSADGKTLRYQQGDSASRVFVFRDAATGEEQRRLPVLPRLPEERFHFPECKPVLTPDGRVLVWGFASFTNMGLWDAKTGNQYRAYGDRLVGVHFPPIFSPDGRTVVAAGTCGKNGQVPPQPDIVLWEAATGKERLSIVPNDRQVKHIVFSPDGRLLASAGRWGTIQVWDAWTGKEVGRFTGHRGPINTLAFASDGKTLASGGADNTILVWDVSGLAPNTKPEIEKLSQVKLAQCWDDLAGADAARAYTAIAEFARHPDQVEGFLKDKLAGFKRMDTQRLPRMIADLDSDDFKTRESASKELAVLGQSAERALREKLDGKPSAELKRRIQDLLDKLDRKEDDPEQRRLLRTIEVLERLGTLEARRLLQKLVEAAPDADTGWEAKASLKRLEKTRKVAP